MYLFLSQSIHEFLFLLACLLAVALITSIFINQSSISTVQYIHTCSSSLMHFFHTRTNTCKQQPPAPKSVHTFLPSQHSTPFFPLSQLIFTCLSWIFFSISQLGFFIFNVYVSNEQEGAIIHEISRRVIVINWFGHKCRLLGYYSVSLTHLCMQNMRQKPYRSFVTCSDPEGVVDCGTVGKERRTMPKSLSRGLREEGVGNLRNSSSQLEEIEKGAQKLNKMIDSWASGMSIDGESKDSIAQDLLRGALDLQESLNMLSKLQEAALYMAKLKRLEKRDEKGRLSVDGSAKSKCIVDLKKVVQDSPVRQNLLPISYGESRWEGRGISCTSEGHSNSLGQSSVSFLKKACSTGNSSVSSDTSDKNRKRPNLIAKLMGLEDRKPVESMASTSNEVHNEKRVPGFDIAVPKSKKPHVLTQTRYQEKKTLRDLLEATQSKANLENKFMERLVPVLDLVSTTTPINRRRVGADKLTPIVLMKPLHTPYKKFEKSHEQCIDACEIVKELKAKKWFSRGQEQNQVSEKEPPMKNDKNIICTLQALTPETSKLPKPVVAKLQRTKTKVKEKAVVSMEQTSQANKISKIVKSPDVSISTKKVAKEKNASRTKLLVSKDALASPSKVNNPDNNLSIMKTRMSIPRKLSQTTTSKFTKEASRDYSVGVNKTLKRKGKPVTRPGSGDTLRHEDEAAAAAADISCQVAQVVPVPVKTKSIAEAVIAENWRDVEVIHDTSFQERSSEYYGDVNYEKVTSNTSCLKSRSFRKNLLMSSPSFAAFVEVIFHLDPSSRSSKVAKPATEMDTDATLFLSYAKEVLERRSNQLLFSATYTSIPVSVNQLLEEVCDAYEAIDSYKDGKSTVDIFDMLHRDMKCQEVVSSAWDLGWKNERSAPETEQIVANLEKLILRDFIDELFVQ